MFNGKVQWLCLSFFLPVVSVRVRNLVKSAGPSLLALVNFPAHRARAVWQPAIQVVIHFSAGEDSASAVISARDVGRWSSDLLALSNLLPNLLCLAFVPGCWCAWLADFPILASNMWRSSTKNGLLLPSCTLVPGRQIGIDIERRDLIAHVGNQLSVFPRGKDLIS